LRNIYWKIADGKGEEERITAGENMQTPRSWSPKGDLCFTDWSPTTKNDLWILRLDENRRQEPFLITQFQEGEARFSPNGSWLAYVTNETGRREVYVLRYPETSKPWQISREGGDAPLWSHDGSELLYRNGDKMMGVDIKTEPSFIAGKPRLLFEGQFGPGDVASDGRFMMVQPLEPEQPATKIHLVLNWFKELKQKAPLP
jgi:serine/threonine-protein kinase